MKCVTIFFMTTFVDFLPCFVLFLQLTKAEGLYKKQLENWSRVVSQMNEQVAALRSLSGSLLAAEGSNGNAGAGSPRAQPPLFSITQSGAPGSAVKNSPMPNRGFRSPAPVTSSETPRGTASAASPGFARYGHTGAAEPAVGTPLAAGKPGTADWRPYSTPSSTRGGEAGSASVTPASAMFNRQYHTRHPPQVSPTPNFYSQYRSSRGAGSSAAGEITPGTTGTAASVAGTTARSTRTATTAHFASLGLRSPQTVGREARMVDPPVQLSQQDQDACTELLISQTDLLEKAQQELEQLENKLKALRREHITS